MAINAAGKVIGGIVGGIVALGSAALLALAIFRGPNLQPKSEELVPQSAPHAPQRIVSAPIVPPPTTPPNLWIHLLVDHAILDSLNLNVSSFALQIQNRGESSIVVKRILFNGKDEGKLCYNENGTLYFSREVGNCSGKVFVVSGEEWWYVGTEFKKIKTLEQQHFPQSISIGGSVLLYLKRDPPTADDYKKDVVFVLIQTDRGEFRYSVAPYSP